jgi:hypothetical protein
MKLKPRNVEHTLYSMILLRDDEPHMVISARPGELPEVLKRYRRKDPGHAWSVAHRFPTLGTD